MLKVEVYVPVDKLEPIRKAIAEYCCSKSDKYSHCMSWHKVQSTWMPLGNAQPFLGKVGELQYAEEYVLSFRCKEEHLDKVIELVKQNHPYEEVTIDVSYLIDSEPFVT